MRLVLIVSLVATMLAAPAAGADQAPSSQARGVDPFMRVYGSAAPPFGFVYMCDRLPAECLGSGFPNERRLEATPLRLSELDEVNRSVNRAIRPVTDEAYYGVKEYWTIPVEAGDCEDYALLKRQILIKRGWPVSALLITVVRDERGDGHAVLTARTGQGDFILDNKRDDVRLWSQTGYEFIMRQSFVDPRLWMSLSPDDTTRSSLLTSNPEMRSK